MGKKKGKGKSQPAQGVPPTSVAGQTNVPHQGGSGSQQGPQHDRRRQQSEHQAGPSQQVPSPHQQEGTSKQEKTMSQRDVGSANIQDPTRYEHERERQAHSVPAQQLPIPALKPSIPVQQRDVPPREHSVSAQQHNPPPSQPKGVWGQKKVWSEPSRSPQQQQRETSSSSEPSQYSQARGQSREGPQGNRPQRYEPRTDGDQLSQRQRTAQNTRPQQSSQKTEYQPRGGRSQQGPLQRQSPSSDPRRDQQMKGSPPTKMLSELQIEEPLPPRELVKSKPGTKGRVITLETNHFLLNLGKLKSAIHYDVVLVPDTPKKYLRHVMEQFRRKRYPDRYPAFDGKKNLYSSTPLPFGDFITDEIVFQEPDGRDKKYKVEIKFTNEVDLTALQKYELSEKTPSEALQVVDIVLRSAPAVTFITVGRSFFLKPLENNSDFNLGEGMEMYSGFYQSAIRGSQPYLNVDVAHKAFPKHVNVVDALVDLFDSNYQPFKRENLQRPLDNRREKTFAQFIKNLKVTYEVKGIPSSKRTYTVNGIGRAPKDEVFELDGGRRTTVENYFLSVKNYKIKYPHLPSLWVGNKTRRVLVPLELCTIEGGQVVNRKLTENQTRNMIRYSATDTNERKQKIQDSLSQARHNVNPAVKEFGFSISGEFEKLDGRVLQPPELEYKDRIVVRPTRGQWRGAKFHNGVEIKKWTIVCADQRLPPRADALDSLARMISGCGVSSGMRISREPQRPFQAIGYSMNDIKKFFQAQLEKEYDVIFVVVPNNGKQYSFVKTAAEINSGCLTQCIKMKTLLRLNETTVSNILLKVNAKLNGTNHFLKTPPSIMKSTCMIMGADVTHPGPEANIPSVAAVTASHDYGAFQYNICWRLQPPRTEIIQDLEAITVEQLKYYQQQTTGLPEKILFFRDGVSEGEFEKVRNKEILAIKSACKKIRSLGDYDPKITFLVVQKRHHTRLFPTRPQDSEDNNFNVPAGTCVDTKITHHFMQDFYLVSHASIQGVAKPTKYRTLWDENEMTNDDIEQLTYYLCHMFTRCNRSVSYPAPTYYAHLAAARARVYIENIENLDMDNLQREYNKCKIQDVILKGRPMFFV